MLAARRALKTFLRDQQGSYTVEFVVLVPLLLSALVFCFEFARALWAYDVMTRDVRAGVRYLTRATGSCGSASETTAENIVKTGLTNGADADAHFPWKGAASTFSCTTAGYSVANFSQNGTIISLTANVPVSFSFMTFLNAVLKLSGGSAYATSYTLAVTDQARYVGD